MLKKRERIIAKVKYKYWLLTHKFGIGVHRTFEEENHLDQHNGNHLWYEAICKDMKNIRVAFDVFDGDVNDLKGYQFVECHIIFDIKMSKKFRRKYQMLAGGHMTASPLSITYSSVVSRYSVRIDMTIAALMACQNLDVIYRTNISHHLVAKIYGQRLEPNLVHNQVRRCLCLKICVD